MILDKMNLLSQVSDLPLTTQDIKSLYNHIDRYVIPRNQMCVKQYAFVFFNEDDRVDAKEEASNFSDALKEAGCQSTNTVWSKVKVLQQMIHDAVNDAKDNSSLLIVGVMSHGKTGCLVGSDGELSVNTILRLISADLPSDIPLVNFIFFIDLHIISICFH